MDSPLPLTRIEAAILEMRGRRVIVDADLAARYGVETRRLNEQRQRNPGRCEIANCDLKARSRWTALRAFSEHGVIMAANVREMPVVHSVQ